MTTTSTIVLLSVSLLSFMACKKEKAPDPVTPLTSNALSSSTKRYIKFTLGTTNYSLEAPQNGVWAAGSGGIQNFGIMPNYYRQWHNYQPTPGAFLYIQDTTTQTTEPVSATYYRSFLSKKDYLFLPENPMGISAINTLGSGVYFYTNDNSQVNWSTVNSANPNSNQNGSTFKIIETAEYNIPEQEIIFKATFNLKLFNNTGDSLMLTNGEMISSFNN